FSSKRRHTNFSRDWSSDVCSSDLSAAELSNEELEVFINQIKEFDFEVAAFTRGSSPALFLKDGKVFSQNLKPITVVDTMGAGDKIGRASCRDRGSIGLVGQ